MKNKNIFFSTLSKTEASAFWLIFTGILGVIFMYIALNNASFSVIALWALSAVFAFLILKRKRFAWFLEQIIIFIIIVVTISPFFDCFNVNSTWRGECFDQSTILFPVVLVVLVPFISLLIDRKNFFKIAK